MNKNIKITGWHVTGRGIPRYENKNGVTVPKERKRYDKEFGWNKVGMVSAGDKIKNIVKKPSGSFKTN